MTVGERLMQAVRPIVPEIAAQVYEGQSREYVAYSLQSWPDLHAEGEPGAVEYLVQVNYYCPRWQNPEATLRDLCEALLAAGFTYPSVTDASDKTGQHYALECRIAEGRHGGA